MDTPQEIIQRVIHELPDDAPLEDIIARLIVESKKMLAQGILPDSKPLSVEKKRELDQDLLR